MVRSIHQRLDFRGRKIAADFFIPLARLKQWIRLAGLQGCMTINGQEVGRGRGELVMGHPLSALAWLANARIEQGLPALGRGEFVLLGSVVATQWLNAGDKVGIEIESLGRLSLHVD